MTQILTTYTPHNVQHTLQHKRKGLASGAEQRNVAFTELCYPSEQSIMSAVELLRLAPFITVNDAFSRIFPAGGGSGLLEGEAMGLVSSVLGLGPKRGLARLRNNNKRDAKIVGVFQGTLGPRNLVLCFQNCEEAEEVSETLLGGEAEQKVQKRKFKTFKMAACGGPFPPIVPPQNTLLPNQVDILSRMLQSAAAGNNVCVIGPRGKERVRQPEA